MLDQRDVRRSAPAEEQTTVSQRDVLPTASAEPAQTAMVRVCWGDAVLGAHEVTEGRSFSVGSGGAADAVDFVLPQHSVMAESWSLISNLGGRSVVNIPKGATGSVVYPSDGEYDLAAVLATSPLAGDQPRVELRQGMTVRLQLGALTFEVEGIAAQARWQRSFSRDSKTIAAFFGSSMLSTGALMGAMAFFVPPLGLNEGERIDADRLYLIQQYLDASAQKEEEPEENNNEEATDETEGGADGAQAAGDEGQMGKTEPVETKGRFSVEGPADNPDPDLRLRSEAETFGVIGLLSSGEFYDGPTAPWARADALGNADQSAMGALFGESIGEAAGANGLGLMGLAEGGGSRYHGIGLSNVGTIGGGKGNCTAGTDCGLFGNGHGRVASGHRVRSPRIRPAGVTKVSGRLPPQTIQRIVRNNYGRMRLCYEKGLMGNPNLEGRVTVRFLISSQGTVARAANSGSSIPAQAVVDCVVRAFYGLSFPKPENGTVTVSYPIMFSPG